MCMDKPSPAGHALSNPAAEFRLGKQRVWVAGCEGHACLHMCLLVTKQPGSAAWGFVPLNDQIAMHGWTGQSIAFSLPSEVARGNQQCTICAARQAALCSSVALQDDAWRASAASRYAGFRGSVWSAPAITANIASIQEYLQQAGPLGRTLAGHLSTQSMNWQVSELLPRGCLKG